MNSSKTLSYKHLLTGTSFRNYAPLLFIVFIISFTAFPLFSFESTQYHRFDILNNPSAPDFSSAGYRGGAEPPSFIPGETVELDPPASGYANAVIQDALTQVGEAGGGTVTLSEGTFYLTREGIEIRYSNVLLRGAGKAMTTLYIDDENTRMMTGVFIGAGATNTYAGSQSFTSSWAIPTTDIQSLNRDVSALSRVVYVDDNSLFDIGEYVIVGARATDDWIAEFGMTGVWNDTMDGPTYCRKIIGKPEGGYLLDLPVYLPLKTRDDARIYAIAPHVFNSGIADLSIEYRPNTDRDFSDASSYIPGTGAYNTMYSRAVKFVNVIDGFAARVEMPLIHSAGFEIAYSAHVTVKDCGIFGSENTNGYWNGYQYFIWGCDNLIDGCHAENGRHNFSLLMAMSSGNVIHDCTSKNSLYANDFHMHLSHYNLVDSFTSDGDFWQSVFRNTGGPILHGLSGTENVFWNIRAQNPPYAYVVHSAQYGMGYVIGTQGAGVNTDPVGWPDVSPTDFVEGEYDGAELEPQSLYLDQVQNAPFRQPASAGVWIFYR